jgi:hypothetical protein
MESWMSRKVPACLRGQGGISLLFAAFALSATPAAAQSDPVVNAAPDPFIKNPEATPVIGTIILMRDVGPRNAILPEVGLRHSVQTSPDQAAIDMIVSMVPISDEQASQITSGMSAVQDINGTIQQPLDLIGGNDALSSGNGTGQGGNGIGGLVSGTIENGMSILGSALGGLGTALGSVGP